jgi:hypothetical protein
LLSDLSEKNRTAVAKAGPAEHLFGTAEPVPFRRSVFPRPASVLSLKFIEKVSLALYQGTTLVVP